MPSYTTGEIAKLCGVSVRTVQYYDSRGILAPESLSEGGRRLYSDRDVQRLRIICFLREAGISIGSIAELFAEENPEQIISLLLDRQEQTLREERSHIDERLKIVSGIRRGMKELEVFSVQSIGDIAHVMKQKDQLTKMRAQVLAIGIPLTLLQWTAILLWITLGLWWLFVVWAILAIATGSRISVFYFRSVSYICPECHKVFRPRMKEAFWAYHTPTMRRLTCPECGKRGLCIEAYNVKEKNHA